MRWRTHSDAIVTRCWEHDLFVDLAMIDRSIVRSGLPSGGRLLFRDWFNIMPTVDTIRQCRVTGRQLLALIEDNAYRLARPNQPHTENGFLHFSRSLRYTITYGEQDWDIGVSDVTLDGKSLDARLDDIFTLACHSFVRGNARGWEANQAKLQLPLIDIRRWFYEDTGLFVRDELLAVIRQHGGVTAAGGLQRDGRL